jgi:hypothetical protein
MLAEPGSRCRRLSAAAGGDQLYSCDSDRQELPVSASVFVHPGISGLVIIGWKSPFTGLVNVSGLFFSDLDPTGFNGVVWSVDRGSQTLASGTIANGGPAQTFSLTNVAVKAGQVLYFIVDPNGDYTSDSTGVDVIVTRVAQAETK